MVTIQHEGSSIGLLIKLAKHLSKEQIKLLQAKAGELTLVDACDEGVLDNTLASMGLRIIIWH